ncbi:3'(2'),5'-bisphosphate nucleotidase CysQ [Salibacterium aidingense]|uniref:3'(2'),5'-bisphosphate nucleotidase CysQ n=1 Tax=Salibacterium aidingense TaxID=384933 RepID=UPI000404B92E|nr:3'(2'),5'-bisphosphate nucleotidase CysQ [Salibacterium aidingense]
MNQVIQAALDAGAAIMDIYKKDFDVEYKEDDSPLTIADQKAHQLIADVLRDAFPDIPVLSEEGKQLPFPERAAWKDLFLVDPLDGTKEFIKKNDEFTVNIALVKQGAPVFGVIYAPALDLLYIGEVGEGSLKVEQASVTAKEIREGESWFSHGTRLPEQEPQQNKARVVASRSHMSEETEAFIEKLKKEYDSVDTVSSGSSLKLCLIAEGAADIYPRFAPTMEWDTGAGQAIIEAAGGTVHTTDSSKNLTYNKENLRNPWFVAESVKS